MRLATRLAIGAAAMVLVSGTLTASEVALLHNGFTIRHERHEQREGVTRLYLTDTLNSYVDIPTEEIAGYEADDYVVPRPVPEAAPAPAPVLGDVVRAASGRNRIDPELIMSVIRRESDFHANAVSPKGARGLMQLMPQTATQLGVENPMDPVANVEGGTLYLRQLLDRYNNNLIKALAAYNAGPQRVDQYGGVPPYAETRAYVAAVVRDFNRKKMTEARVAVRSEAPAKRKGKSKSDTRAAQPRSLPASVAE